MSNSLESTAANPAEQQGGSRVISRVLPPAVRLWIQSQLDHVETLEFRLEGKDRQILSGYVPQIWLSAGKAVYQGLHLSQVRAAATEIRINPGQMLRGKPLRLQQPFPIQGQVCLFAEDLQASLHSSLLAQGLQDVLLRLVNAHPALFPEESHLRELIADFSRAPATTDIMLSSHQLTMTWKPDQPEKETVALATGLQVQAGHLLCLTQPRVWVVRGEGNAFTPIALDDFVIDLGSEVEIQTLTVKPEVIEVQGTVRVVPGS